MKISFLVHHFYQLGGVNSSVANLVGELSKKHDVEITTVFRGSDVAPFVVPDSVMIKSLVDLRPHAPNLDSDSPLIHQEPRFLPAFDAGRKYSRLSEVRMFEHLSEVDAEVVVATQPVMAMALGAFPGSHVSIYQAHSTAMNTMVADFFRKVSAGIDAIVPVCRGLVGKYSQAVAGHDIHVESIYNSVAVPKIDDSRSDAKIIMAGGRLVPGKRFADIIRAFSATADKHPGWSVRIYGGGPEEGNLRALITELGLEDRALIMGASRFMDSEWAKAGILVSASRAESFGMTLVEAMRLGVPSVAADCNYGPREIVSDGEDGLLVKVGDVEAMGEALDTLMSTPDRRAAMGEAAKRNMDRFRPANIASQWEDLFELLRNRRKLPDKASWSVDANNNIQVTVTTSDVSGDELTLLARRAKPAAEKSFPFHLDSVDSDGKLRYEAVISGSHESLEDGDWSLRISNGRPNEECVLSADWYDDREFMDYSPWHPDGARVRVPYVGESGDIWVASRIRQQWAEVERMETSPDGFRFVARAHGFRPGSDKIRLMASPRDGSRALPLELTDTGNGMFEARVRYQALLPHADKENNLWDVVFMPENSGDRIRVGRISGDYTNKRNIHNYPFLVVPPPGPDPSGGTDAAADKKSFRGKPYYTPHGEIAIVLRKS